MIWLLRTLIVIGVSLATLAIWEQPRMADDWYLAWLLEDAGSIDRFVAKMYLGWGGRVFSFALGGLALSSEAATLFFKALTVPCFVLIAACTCYLGTGKAPRLGYDFLLVAAVLWLGLPVVSDTIVQITGAAAYLWPATAGLGMLCMFRRARDLAHLNLTESSGWGPRVGWFAGGMIVGTCNEQLFAGIFVVLVGWGWMLWRESRLRYLTPKVWWGVVGLIIGALILIGAPGNYVRFSAPVGSSGILSMVMQYAMYLGGAYFGLGTGDAGRVLWLGIGVIALNGVLTLTDSRGKDGGIWITASLATLAPMLPLVNFASPRTTFLAAIFLVVAVTTVFPPKRAAGATLAAAQWVVAFALAMLVVIDGLVGWVANRALVSEMNARMNIIQSSLMAGNREVALPYLTTIPSRLTFMLNPVHDLEFGAKLAAHYGLVRDRSGESADQPQPYTVNTLKELKKRF